LARRIPDLFFPWGEGGEAKFLSEALSSFEGREKDERGSTVEKVALQSGAG